MGGLFLGQSFIQPEAQAAPTTHKIGTFPLHDWWASSHKISVPLKVDGQTLYTGDDGDSWGYLKTNGEPVTDANQTLFGTPSTTPTSSTNPSPSGSSWIATVAVDANVAGNRAAAYGYSWDWDATSNVTGALRTLGVTVPTGITNSNTIPVFRIKDGQMEAQWTTVPVSSYFGQTGGNMYWSGGEVIQSTGQIFFSGGECAAMNDQFSMMIFDPNSGEYNFSGLIKPATAADNIFGTASSSCGGTGYVSSDMALDANGNAYVLAVSNRPAPNFGITTTSSRSWLVRIVPSWDPMVDWTYELVTPITAGPGQGNVPVGSDVGTVWGMAFYQGSLYAIRPDYNISQINVMSGQAYNIPPGSRVARLSRNAFDLASGQTAIVVQGTVYNDVGADGSIAGDPGLPGQQVALYMKVGNTYVYEGMRYTNEQGNYSFLVAGNGSYVVRLAQPSIDGVNAAQTYASGGGALNPVTAQCVNGNVTSLDGAACTGALAMPTADPALPTDANAPGSDTSTQVDKMPIYSTIEVTSAAEVVNADFAVTAAGSFGDAAAGPATLEAGAPVHVSGAQPPIWLGAKLGSYSGPATDNKAHNDTDDGVYIDSYAGKLSLTNTVLAGTKSYRLAGDVSGPAAGTGSVVAWTTTAGTNTWGSVPVWSPTITAGKAAGDYQYQSSGNLGAGGQGVQMRVNASTVAQAGPTNADGGYQGAAAWTSPGEIEDYAFTVADAVYRPAATTSGSTGTFTVAGAEITTGKDVNVGPAVGTVSGSPVNLTASTPASWTVSGVTVKETESGTTIAQPSFTISGGTASFSYTPAQGTDVIIEVAYARDPDPAKSTLTLDTDTAQVGKDITATVAVNDVDGEGLNGVEVTFGKKSTEISLSDLTCTTTSEGVCSVTLTSAVAKTFTNEISATVKVAAQDTAVSGSPQTVTFTSGGLSYTTSTFVVTPEASVSDKSTWRTADGTNAYTGVLTAKDENGNLLTSLSAWDMDFSVSSTNVVVSPIQNNKDGTYSVTYTSRVASPTPTVSLAYEGKPVGASKPIPFKAGPPALDPTCTDPQRPGTNLAVSPASLGINGVSNATALVTDADCNPVPDAVVTFWLDPGSNAVLTVVQSTTDNEGKAYASVTDASAETVKVRAKIPDGELRGSPASVTFTTGGFSWMNSSFTVAPQADLADRTTWMTANGTSAYTGTLTAKDNGGNPLSSLPVDDIVFTASSTDVSVSSVVNNGNGMYSVKFTTRIASPAQTATVAYQGAQVGTAKPIPFKAGPVALEPDCTDPTRPGTKVWANPTTLGVNGTSNITALLTDAECNPISDSTVNFTLDPGSSATLAVVRATTDAEGRALATVTDSVAETVKVRARVTEGELNGSPASVRFTAGGLSWTESTFSVTPQADLANRQTWMVADGTSAYTGVLTTKDNGGNLLSNLSVSDMEFTASHPSVSVSSVLNNQDGTYSVRFTSRVASASVTASAAYQGEPVGTAKAIPFKAGPPVLRPECTDPALMGTNLTVDPRSLPVGGISKATALVTDASCNPVPDVMVNFSLDSSTSAVLTVVQSTTDTDGKAYANLTDSLAGTVAVHARITEGELNGSPASVTFTTGGFSWMDSSFVVTPQASVTDPSTWMTADGTSAYQGTLTAVDNKQVPLTDLDVADIAFTASSSDVTVSSVVNAGSGRYTATFVSKVASAAPTASLSYQGTAVGTAKPIPFKAGAPDLNPICTDPARPGTNLSVDPAQLGVRGTSTATALVTDASCNPVPNVAVAFTLDQGSSAVLSVTQATTGADGKAYATLTDAVAETVKVHAAITAGELKGSPASVTFTTGGLSWVDSTFTVTPQASLTDRTTWLVADGTCAYEGVLTAKDNGGNLLSSLSSSDIVFAASSSDVTVSSVVNSGSGRYTVTFVSTHASANSTASVTYQGNQVGTAKPIPFKAGPPAPNPECTDPARPGTNLTVTPKNVLIPAGATAIALVTDENCNPVDEPVEVRFSTEKSAAVTPAIAQTGTDGKATAQVNDAIPETVNVRAMLAGEEIMGSPAQVTFMAGGFSAVLSTFSVTPVATPTDPTTWLTANGTSAYTGTLTAKDNEGNPLLALAASDIVFTASSPDVAVSSVVNAGSGRYTVTFTSRVASPATASLNYMGDPVGTSLPIPFKAGEAVSHPTCGDPGRPGTNLSVDPHSVAIPNSSTATAYITDADCNPVGAGVQVRFSVDGNAVLSIVNATTDGTGKAVTVIRDDVAESVDVRAVLVGSDEITGSPARVTFLDTTPPNTPTVDKANATEVAGTSDPDTTVWVTWPDGTVSNEKVAANGKWSVKTPADMESGTITVVAKDPSGNESEPVVTTLDTEAPSAPTIDHANATEVAGTSDPGTSVQVSWPDGTLTKEPVGENGKWSVKTPSDMGSGTITVIAVDPAGNESEPVSTTLDTEAPSRPTVDHANATEVAGTSEPGATVRVTWPDGSVTSNPADKDGKWSVKTPDGMGSGTITVVAVDPAGNESDPVTTTLDTDVPKAPVVNPSNGSAVTGTAEPGTKVRVSDENGNLVPGCEEVLVDENGNFAAIPAKPLKPGSSVTVTVVDQAGNVSDPVTVSIGNLGIVIAYPTRNPGDTQVVTGTTFNPGEKVCLTTSTPLDVPCGNAGPDGEVTFTFSAPQGFDLGTQVVTLTGERSGSVSGSFSVVEVQIKTGGSLVPAAPMRGLAAGLILSTVGLWIGVKH